MTKGKTRRSRRLLYVALVLGSFFSLWPVFVMALEGFDIDLSPLFSGRAINYVAGIPYVSGGIFPTIIHYADALRLGNFPRLVINSSIIDLLSVGLALAVGLPAAYSLARFKLRAKSAVAFLLLALRTVSPFALILPLYLLFVRNNLWDTYQGVALAYLAIVLPVSVWLLRGFISDIPRETYDAAELFGASERQIFWRVAFPLILPGIVVTVIFGFALLWNEFLMADVLTGPLAKTASVGVWAGAGESSGFRQVAWDDLNAAGTLSFIPAVILIVLIRKYLARGFSLATAR